MTDESLLDLLTPSATATSDRVFGVVVGIVSNNQDPEGMGRIKVRFPWLSETAESFWARVAVPMAGNGRGTWFLPEVDDEVLVAFDHGDVRFPYVLGGLWNGQDQPPESNDDGENNVRVIRSRSGHEIRLDDTDGGEKIEITGAGGRDSIVVDAANDTITITADSDLTIEAKNGTLKLAGNGVEIASGAALKIEASQNADLESSAQVNVKGSVINLN